VAEALAEIKVDLAAMLASTMRISHLIDRIDMGLAPENERGVHRLLVNINKYWTSVQASLSIRRAQEILGGNGAIEDFSIIPRLYRDALVFESWEGSHNVLCLQAMRDMRKYQLHKHLFAYLEQLLQEITAHSLYDQRLELTRSLDQTRHQVETLLAADPEFQQTHIRRVIDRMAALSQAVCLLSEAGWELSQAQETDKALWLDFFLNRYLRPHYDPLLDPEYTSRLQKITAQL
jgi:alkylation response protein AidB-like acyl-CoA dehydrogenase